MLNLTCGIVSGDAFEDKIAGLTWPCILRPGWSVEWDGSSNNNGTACAD